MIVLFLLSLVCASYQVPLSGLGNFDYEGEFERFVQTFNKVYKDESDRRFRFHIFVENVKQINEHQKNAKTNVVFGINKFSDWTKEEKAKVSGYRPKNNEYFRPNPLKTLSNSSYNLPSSFDWRIRNMVTSVKDQGQCGSCWTFQTAAIVESHVLLNGGPSLDLSEQELVDCDHIYGSAGCDGGEPDGGLLYVTAYGLENNQDYPYRAVNQLCTADYKLKDRTFIEAWEYLNDDENYAAYTLIQLGPIGYNIWVPESLYNYQSGVYWPTEQECYQAYERGAGHSITIVGFGTENGVPYWTIKNSWGSDWGDQGYFKIHRGNLTCACGYEAGTWFVAVTK